MNTRFLFIYYCYLLQEHQDNILGNTMQTAVALLNNVVANKSTNMMLLFTEGMSLPLVILLYADASQPAIVSCTV